MLPSEQTKSVEQRLSESDVRSVLSGLSKTIPAGSSHVTHRETRDRSEPKQQLAQSIGERKVSGKLPRPTDEELHGGWRLTDETFLRAARHPQAEVISSEKPYVVRYKQFLSTIEVDHLLGLAEGTVHTKSDRVSNPGAFPRSSANETLEHCTHRKL